MLKFPFLSFFLPIIFLYFSTDFSFRVSYLVVFPSWHALFNNLFFLCSSVQIFNHIFFRGPTYLRLVWSVRFIIIMFRISWFTVNIDVSFIVAAELKHRINYLVPSNELVNREDRKWKNWASWELSDDVIGGFKNQNIQLDQLFGSKC